MLHLDLPDIPQEQVPVDIHDVLGFLAVHFQDAISILESQLPEVLSHVKAVGHIVNPDVLISPDIEHHDVDEDAENEIDRNPAEHDDQPLPGRLGPELPGLWRFLELFLVHALIDHPGDLHIASQGDPTDSVHRFPDLLLEEREFVIEEKIELLNPGLKQLCGYEVAHFMQHDQQGQAQQELGDLDI